MKNRIKTAVIAPAMVLLISDALAQRATDIGTEEFGLTPRQLRDHIERSEQLIAKCMREEGFQYTAADFLTVRKGMAADKKLPGISEEEFVQKYGFGVSTFYTGEPPQLSQGYNPGKVGLGERNVADFRNLSPADQIAYNRALFGENVGETLAIALETENLSRTGGCTRKAIEQIFEPEQLKANYYNPKDALINKDPRMRKAIRDYAEEMRDAGFNYNHPDEVEPDIRDRLAALSEGGTLRIENMTPEQRAALKELQDYERRVAAKDFELAEEIFDPVETQIERELYPREVK